MVSHGIVIMMWASIVSLRQTDGEGKIIYAAPRGSTPLEMS